MAQIKAEIHLKRGKEQSLQRMHPWVFSGAIETFRSQESQVQEGELVDVFTKQGDFIARGHYEIGSITVRVLTFEQEDINSEWWQTRIRTAFQVREALGLTSATDTTCYRLIHGEGDSLPGLVVDIYNKTDVIQCHSVGMYRLREQLSEAILQVYAEGVEDIYDKSAQTVPF